VEETVEFAKRMEKTGIAALAIHGRQKTERSRAGFYQLFLYNSYQVIIEIATCFIKQKIIRQKRPVPVSLDR
jgi:tRNA-dihydrouridine synthase